MAAELANDFHELVETPAGPLIEGKSRMRVLVSIDDMAGGEEVAARRDIDLSRGIISHGPIADFHGLVLAPRLIEWHPLDDGRMIVKRVDHALELG